MGAGEGVGEGLSNRERQREMRAIGMKAKGVPAHICMFVSSDVIG